MNVVGKIREEGRREGEKEGLNTIKLKFDFLSFHQGHRSHSMEQFSYSRKMKIFKLCSSDRN